MKIGYIWFFPLLTLSGLAGLALLVLMASVLPWWAYFGLWFLLITWVGHKMDQKRKHAEPVELPNSGSGLTQSEEEHLH